MKKCCLTTNRLYYCYSNHCFFFGKYNNGPYEMKCWWEFYLANIVIGSTYVVDNFSATCHWACIWWAKWQIIYSQFFRKGQFANVIPLIWQFISLWCYGHFVIIGLEYLDTNCWHYKVCSEFKGSCYSYSFTISNHWRYV